MSTNSLPPTPRTAEPGSSKPKPSGIERSLREPLVHFALLGLLLFGVNAWREGQRSAQNVVARIEVTAGTIASLREGFTRQWNRAPDAEELRGLVEAHIREEVLCREALAMGLDRDDTIVRRRMAQKMEFLTQDIATAAAPDEAALAKFFAENAARYAKPSQVSFRHVYFSKEKRGTTAEAEAGEALAALKQGAPDDALGDAFLHGFKFAARESQDVIALFGAEFEKQLATQTAGVWQGPVASSYGLHLILVEERSAPQPVKFEDVRTAVVRDFNEERRLTANREVFEKLRARYQVTVDETAMAKPALPPTQTARR